MPVSSPARLLGDTNETDFEAFDDDMVRGPAVQLQNFEMLYSMKLQIDVFLAKFVLVDEQCHLVEREKKPKVKTSGSYRATRVKPQVTESQAPNDTGLLLFSRMS